MKDGRRILEDLGYRVAFRRQGWTECLAWRDDERWLGHGGDEQQALDAVVGQMFPSEASRRLLQAHVATPGESPRVDDAPPSRVYSRSEALEALTVLSDRIDGERPDLGLMAPARQRMVMLAWICRARTWEDRRPGDSFVARQVASIARKITLLGKIWWPGSVRSLHVNSTPADAVAEAGVDVGWTTRDWATAAELLDKRLAKIFARDESLGRDDYGWMDGEQLNPPPDDAGAMLASLVSSLSAAAGSLSEPARPANRGGYSPRPEDAERFLMWARQLRWMRGAASDFESWGAAIGRLRWLALQNETRSSALGELLDPDYAPPSPWAEHQTGDTTSTTSSVETNPLIVSVRGQTEGMRALLVAGEGQTDHEGDSPGMRGDLEQTFGLAVSTSEAQEEELSTVLPGVEKGEYDLLVLSTRFGDFAADARLATAARDAKIPYVRVYRPRPLGTARALAQQMDLRSR